MRKNLILPFVFCILFSGLIPAQNVTDFLQILPKNKKKLNIQNLSTIPFIGVIRDGEKTDTITMPPTKIVVYPRKGLSKEATFHFVYTKAAYENEKKQLAQRAYKYTRTFLITNSLIEGFDIQPSDIFNFLGFEDNNPEDNFTKMLDQPTNNPLSSANKKSYKKAIKGLSVEYQFFNNLLNASQGQQNEVSNIFREIKIDPLIKYRRGY
ncbi:hypothetical protein [Aquimarina macrocephali]|uniref:hypothetical protein n=1 Tax=Aquimarina macrocephali TaxID=666563 RepID=UPI000466A207|nr:hypothetical protein [Aquimarina macrocephali]